MGKKGLFGKIKETAEKADETMEQAGKDLSDTSNKVQKVLDESGKSVQLIVKSVSIALLVSVAANVVNIILAIANRRSNNAQIRIEKLYLGGFQNGKQ